MSKAPTQPGHYWAQWRIAGDDTPEELLPPAGTWEVVEVWENSTDVDDPERLLVFVGGVVQGQALENFFWDVRRLERQDAK